MAPRLGSARAVGSWPLGRWVRVVGISGGVIILAVIVVGALAIVRLNTTRHQLVDLSSPALIYAQALNSALLNQESGVRGFAATGADDFAQPYRDGRAAQDRAVATLRGIAAEDPVPALTTQLDAVLAAAASWQREYADPTITAVTAAGPGAALDPAIGKTRFDVLRAALTDELRALNAERMAGQARLDGAVTELMVVGIIAAVMLVVLLLGIGLWIRRIVQLPIRDLAAEVRQVREGRFDRPVEGRGAREVVELGEDIDDMRGRINGALITTQALNGRLDLLNRQLEEQRADLARSNSDLEQFAYVASHDLQEPLRKVSSFCELLAKRYSGQLDERADQYIGFAVDGARRMSALINDLLRFSRVGRTTSRDTWTKLPVGELLDQAERNLAEAIETDHATVTRDAELPTVTGERSLLAGVLQNLVGNAIKFHGDEPPRVHVGARRDGEFWELSVSDNGIGIEPAYAERIFVIFQRLHAKEAYPGTGIGLALCRKVVEFHGGRIWLDPAPDGAGERHGTTFRFTLPVEAPTAVETPQLVPATSSETS
jgi:signal transduction histidine kinase